MTISLPESTLSAKNFNQLRDLMGEKFPMLLGKFYENLQEFITSVTQVELEGQDIQQMKRYAHTIKSNALSFGFCRLSKISKALEYSYDQEDFTQYEDHKKELVDSFSEIQDFIQEHL